MKFTTNAVLLAMVSAAQAKEAFVFDPSHLYIGNSKYSKELRTYLNKAKNAKIKEEKMAAELAAATTITAASATPPAADTTNIATSATGKSDAMVSADSSSKPTPESNALWGDLDAATKVSNAAPAIVQKAERRLRGTESSFGVFGSLSASIDSFWEGIVETVDTAWEETVEIFTGPPANVTANITSFPTFEPTYTPTTGPTRPPVAVKQGPKPKKRAEKFVEYLSWTGDSECRVKPNTYFRSQTLGVEACFLSSLATEDQPLYTLANYLEVIDEEESNALSTSFTLRLFYDSSCTNEVDMKGYYPLSGSLPQTCSVTPDSHPVESHLSKLWKLSHAPHRETAGHQMSISIFSRGRDCLKGQTGGTLQERITVSYGSHYCHPTDEGNSFFMKCLKGGDISIHWFENAECKDDSVHTAVVSREDLCKSTWSGDYTSGSPVVQCGVGENWDNNDTEQPGLELA